MRLNIDAEMSLNTLNQILAIGWIDYDPAEHIRCYRTWSKQVIPHDEWKFDLLINWQIIKRDANIMQAISFLELE